MIKNTADSNNKTISFDNFKDVCKHQDVVLVSLKNKECKTKYYCDYNTPSTICDCIENCPVLKTKEV